MNTEMPNLAPHSVEAEEAVLGSILLNAESLELLHLEPSDFFMVKHSWVYESMLAMYERKVSIDILTLCHELKAKSQLTDIGGPAFLTGLLNQTPTHINVEVYAGIVEATAVRRRLLTAASDIAAAALQQDAPTEQVVDQAIRILDDAAVRHSAAFLSSGNELYEDTLKSILGWLKDPTEVRGLRSGIPKLDAHIGGFGEGRMYTLYGATGMGKSTLAGWIAINLMEQAPGLVISTEMDSEFWLQRVIADMAGIPFRQLESGHLSKEQQSNLKVILERIKRLKSNFTTLRMSEPTPTDIRGQARRLMRQGRCKWVLIDSVNNIRVPGVTDIYPRTTEAADCALSLAYDGLSVLATSQTGRNAKTRASKLPQLNDAEGSGKIEQNSHMVIGIYRHEYYVERGEAKPNAAYPDGRTLLSILKNRTGPSGNAIPVTFKPGVGYEYDARTVSTFQIREAYDEANN